MFRTTALLTLAATLLAPPAAMAQVPAQPPAQPAARPPAHGKAAARPIEQVQADLRTTSTELGGLVGNLAVLFDDAKRAEIAPRAVPLLKRTLGLLDEFVAAEPRAKDQIDDVRLEHQTVLVVLGDADAKAALEKAGAGAGDEAVAAKLALKTAAYWLAGKDPAAQAKILDEVGVLAQHHPKHDGVANTLMKLANVGAADKTVREKAYTTIVEKANQSDLGQMYAESITARRKLREKVGQPVDVGGQTLDGKTVSTKDWRGKVVLVDFWATWCAPCVAAMPGLKKTYAEHRAKGFEILGVSSDTEAEPLKKFLEQDKEISWPQLFTPPAPDAESEFHPEAIRHGVKSLPMVFLIDRKGVLRAAGDPAEAEEMLPKLLEEKAQ